MNNSVKFTDSADKTIKYASEIAIKLGTNQIGSEHILYGLLNIPSSLACKKLKDAKVDKERLYSLFLKNASNYRMYSNQMELSPVSKNIISIAQNLSVRLEHNFVSAEHIFLATLYSEDCYANRILETYFRVDIYAMRDGLMEDMSRLGENEKAFEDIPDAKPEKTLPDNLLEMGYDLTYKAKQGKMDPIIGREQETERIIEILCRKTKNNPILIGEPGVGKTAVVEGLAQAIVKGRVPQVLRDKIIYSLDIASLMAGTKYRGELEKRLKDAIETIIENKNIIVFIDEIHTLAQSGSEKGDVSPSDMLKPYLARGELQTIGATTTDEYRKFIEKDKALERRFQPIMVNPPSVDDAIEILKGIRDSYEAFHKVKITDEAIVAAAKLSDRYIMDRSLPDKAIDLIDEASSRARVTNSIMPKSTEEKMLKYTELHNNLQEAYIQGNNSRADRLKDEMLSLYKIIEEERKANNLSKPKSEPTISENDIAEVIAKWTGIPVSKITESEKEKLIRLEDLIHKRVIGQEEAVTAVCKAIRRSRVGLQDGRRPIGSFLFLGQTGVGKTELCKALAEAMFDNENNIIRIDMSEYMESHSVAKLIGAPPGYVGHDDGGQLTEQVRRKPYSVVLFDEIEKAHPDVFNIMLQMLDDGRLTDSQGRVVNFKNTIIIMTSNCGISELHSRSASLGFSNMGISRDNPDYDQMKDIIMASVRRKFKPELLNRIDVITVFHSLGVEELTKIAKLMLSSLNKRLKEHSIDIKFTESALRYVVEKGTNPEYGARPLKRLIQQEIEDQLADGLLSGELNQASVIVDSDGNKLYFKNAN